jgi:putative DNA primase/helicase
MNEILLEMRLNGLEPGDIISDGTHQRFAIDESDTKKSGWYKSYQNFTRKSGQAFFVVLYGNHRTGDEFKFVSNITLTRDDSKALKLQMEAARKEAAAKKAEYQEQTSVEVSDKWDTFSAVGESDYLTKKLISGLPNLGIRFSPKGDAFYVPMRDIDGKHWSVQRIQNDGKKFFHPGGKVDGNFHVIGDLQSASQIRVAEGFATAGSIALATGEACVVAFTAGNLEPVCKSIRSKYPSASVLVCGDDDIYSKRAVGGVEESYNAGRTNAEAAAKAVLGKAIFPTFQNPEKGKTDFNDLHFHEGIDAVKNAVSKIEVKKLFLNALGFSGKEYFFTSSNNKIISVLTAFSETEMMKLMPIEYWESVFPGGGKSRVDWVQAKSTIMAECHAVGFFQPQFIRGRGTWFDDGRTVVNMGDHLIVDGDRVELGEIRSRYFYTLSAALNPLHANPLTVDDCDTLINACGTFKWLKPEQGFLLAGFIVVARICGALPIRPHVWVTGGSSTGKSTLLERFVSPLLGQAKLHVQGGTSEAGLRQSLKCDAVPVVFDEFESTTIKSQENVNACTELMRSAWSISNAMIVKGSAGGSAEQFQVCFCAIVSSIRTRLTNDADRSRFAIVELAPHGSDSEHWALLSGYLDQITEEYGDRLFSRSIKMIPVLLNNFKTLKKSLSGKVSQRFGDQYGMLLAGYSILISDEPLSEEEAEMLVSHVKLSEEKEQAKVADHNDALTQINTSVIQIEREESNNRQETYVKRDSWVVSDAIIASKSDMNVKRGLLAYGIRVELDYVWFAGPSHGVFAKTFFKGTHWEKSYIASLARTAGAEKRVMRIGTGFTGQSIGISLDKYAS